MDAEWPSFLVRAARTSDHSALLQLARQLDSINLPTETKPMQELLECSVRSFRGRVRARARARYVFCVEQIATKRIVAASMIIAKHGTPEAPHYYLALDSDERYSHSLRKMFRHPYLKLRYSMDGPTEIGGLIVDPAMRGRPEHVGKQVSWVRFLYLAMHPARFESEVVAEMLAPMSSDHGNVFWDHYGGRVTGLSFREADILSTRDKEFIRALFPETPLYTFMLPQEVREALGAVGENSRGAVRLLEQAGMRFLNQIDPFDGGPYYGAPTAALEPIKNHRVAATEAGEPDSGKQQNYLIAVEDGEGFRAIRAEAELRDKDKVVVNTGALAALGIAPRVRVNLVPLP
jgi:arginine N-succinyltransferase